MNVLDQSELLSLRFRLSKDLGENLDAQLEPFTSGEEDMFADNTLSQAKLMDLCLLLQNVLQSVKNDGGIRVLNLMQVKAKRNEYSVSFNLENYLERKDAHRPGDVIPLHELGFKPEQTGERYAQELFRQFDLFLTNLTGGLASVGRCEHCGGLFTEYSPIVERVYCSPRCVNRAGVKRYREKHNTKG